MALTFNKGFTFLFMQSALTLTLFILFINSSIIAQLNITSPQIQIIPDKALIDENVRIQLTGFQPGQHIILRVRATDDINKKWESYAEFQSNGNGIIKLSSQKPLSGTYTEVDSMGLFWSMKLVAEEQTSIFNKSSLKPIMYFFTAEVENKVLASATFERLFIAEGVIRIPVRENGLAGTLFIPDSINIHPSVILLGGSGGGLSEINASLLASNGYVAFALAYFNYEHLPAGLVNIPLEYIETALHWLQKRTGAGKIALFGESRGGELALLSATIFPGIKAVIATVPSAFLWEGVWGDASAHITYPSWTYKGIPFPIMRSLTQHEKQEIYKDEPLVHSKGFYLRIQDNSPKNKAIIPVEKIKGPILLISAKDDHLWPSSIMSDMIVKRLQQNRFTYKVEHLSYEGAGHRIRLPNLPTTVNVSMHPVRKKLTSLGGNAKDNAWAAFDSWQNILKFLRENLK